MKYVLVRRHGRRHHARMIATHALPLAKLAEHLRDDEVHVWRLNYQPQRQRAPLRKVLAAYLGVDGDQVMLTHGEYGRPALADTHDQTLGFNWSHSGGHALIAVGRGVAPGIDVERLRTRPRALEIAARYFSSDEAAALAALPASARPIAFLELWTAKEAVLKALGRGLAFGLDRLTVGRSVGRLTLQRLEGDDANAWQLQRLPVDATLVAAVAWRGGTRQIRLGTLASDT
ncbi:4'-phosphopantetheinyl transferase family protein [Rhodanobacter umsongensis]|uniref:4'-phosphopantetheinyl transferase family protein n=1 Tax=Rhodanobacter umsongensis TaxID=633153 RepID=A0ABW0JQH1_9GAMM